MAERLTIRICNHCGAVADPFDTTWRYSFFVPALIEHAHDGILHGSREVRVFREEDVRPLWEAVKAEVEDVEGRVGPNVLDAFPAPEEWKR